MLLKYLSWIPSFKRKFFQPRLRKTLKEAFEYLVQDQKHPGLFLSCRVLKWFRFSLLIQRNSEKGFCPGRYYDEIEQTNHVRPYLTLFWFRLCLSYCSWCTARLNIILHAHATVNLYLFSIRRVVSGKSSNGHQGWWNHGPAGLFVSYISASEGLHSKEWLLALHREKQFASTKFKASLLQSEWALSSASQYFSWSLLRDLPPCNSSHVFALRIMFHIMGLEMRDMFHCDSVQGAGQHAPTFLMAGVAGASCF